jgi:beta-glucosidase
VRRLVCLAAGLIVLALPAAAGAAGRCGSHPWCNTALSPDQRAGLLVGALTRDEKIGLLGGDDLFGVGGGEGTHTGTSTGVPRVDVPTTYYSDGPVGPRSGKATSMPSPMALASTFDRALANAHGSVVGNEVKAKGNDVVFAPTTNIMRTPLGGRTFESYGEDPFLQARLGVEWIRGAQAQGVIGNVKHYAVNNQEGQGASFPGAPVGVGVQGSRLTVDERVDERTLREIYLPHFEAAVKEAGVGSVMCSYPRVNGQYACENKHLLEILKREWGFKGYVLADYGAAKNTGDSLVNGLDFDPWPGFAYGPTQVNAAMAASGAASASLDDHVRRILRSYFQHGFFDRAAYPYDDGKIDKQGHASTAGRIEESGIVLMKNDDVLPFDTRRVRSLALIGSDADKFKSGGGSSNVTPFFSTTPKQGIEKRAGSSVKVSYDTGENADQAASLARAADVAVVVVADTSSEGTDKPCMGLGCGSSDNLDRDALIDKVAAANKRTVVVMETGAPVLTPWRDKVAGLLEAWYPGVEGGTALARVLFGDVNPSGHLPATFPKREADEPTSGDPETYPGVAETVTYKEGVFVGYRWFDEKGIAPAFPFGHGLSYTSFSYTGLDIARHGNTVRVAVDVKNTGKRAGTETVQLYLGMPDPRPGVRQPPRQLKGFQRLALAPGTTRTARFELGPRDFSYWNTASNDWSVARGCYSLMAGRSSRDIRVRGEVGQGGARCAGVCAVASGFKRVSARPRGRGLSARFSRRLARPVSVAVYQQARRRRVGRARVVAWFSRHSRSFRWNGRANVRGRHVRDGYLFARFRMRGLSGLNDTRRIGLRRSHGRFFRRPAFQRRDSCGLVRAYRLSGPAFGGSTRRPLGVAYRLARRARVSLAVYRGKRLVKRFRAHTRRGTRVYRLRIRAARRGNYRVRLTARAGRTRVKSTLVSRRL